MKKFLFVTAVGFALFASCEEEPQEKPEEPKDPYWRTTHQYVSVTVNDDAFPWFFEEIKELREFETSIEVTEAESYQLSFKEDGTGSGSGVRRDGVGRYNFDFTWQLSDTGPLYLPQLPDEKWLTLTEIGDGYGGMFFTYDRIARDRIVWRVEEFTNTKMVLSFIHLLHVDREHDGWMETHTYRYTFEKVD